MTALDSPTGTSSSLIGRVRLRDPDAWSQLARLYGPLVYHWARQCGLQAQDAADITQDVFLSVARGIDEFRQDAPGSSFRGWLWTITRNTVRLHLRKRPRQPEAIGGTDAHQQWQAVPELLDAEEEPTASHSRAVLIQKALGMIRGEFAPATWQAFERLTIAADPVEDIARDLGLSPGAVRQAKYRVLCRLRELLE